MGTPIVCAAGRGTVQAIDVGVLFPLADTTGTTSRSNKSRRHLGDGDGLVVSAAPPG